MDKHRIWMLHKINGELRKLENLLNEDGHSCLISSELETLMDSAPRYGQPSVFILDAVLAESSSTSFLEDLGASLSDCAFLIVVPSLTLDRAVSSFRLGAHGYLRAPLIASEAFASVKSALAHRHAPIPDAHFEADNPEKEIIGISKPMLEVYKIISKLSQSNATVLLSGESGTGKELIARAFHRHSPRRDQPFVAINMAAIPYQLIESELFGHEQGAFTGAGQQHRGFFEQAEGGTLFLDEIGDMSIDLQTRLLRVIAEREFHPVGSSRPKRSDVRIIAATHHNLLKSMREGKFREDLYHRLNVIKIELPPLRERGIDILLLVRSYLDHFAREAGIEPKQVSPEVEVHLSNLSWPGNVRQLENMCRWLTVMADGNWITIDMLPEEIGKPLIGDPSQDEPVWQDALRHWIYHALRAGHINLAQEVYLPAEKIMIEAALEISNGRRVRAAKLLGLGRNTLSRKLSEGHPRSLRKSISS